MINFNKLFDNFFFVWCGAHSVIWVFSVLFAENSCKNNCESSDSEPKQYMFASAYWSRGGTILSGFVTLRNSFYIQVILITDALTYSGIDLQLPRLVMNRPTWPVSHLSCSAEWF